MFLLTNLKQLWSLKMSKLLEKGFGSSDIANINAYIKTIKEVNIKDKTACNIAVKHFHATYNLLTKKMTNTEALAFFKTEFGIEIFSCRYDNNSYPSTLMVTLPNGKICNVMKLHSADFEYEFADNGTVILANRLYGDKNILAYNADVLQYCKFRCMPDERLQNNLVEDELTDTEYNGYAPVFLGIELEVEKKDKTPKKIEHMVAADLGMDYVILKHDGSLQDGFEIVTAPATLRFHLQAWEKFWDNSGKLLQSWASGRCGMHVHVSRKSFTPMHLAKFNTFLNNFENRDFVTTIAGRNSTYSKFYEDKEFHIKSKLVSTITDLYKEIQHAKLIKANEVKIKELEDKLAKVRTQLKNTSHGNIEGMLSNITNNTPKYSALNLSKPNTVEVRIFRGNVCKIGMLKNLELVAAAVEFTRDATFLTRPLNADEIAERKLKRKENTDYSLHYTYFLDWLEKDTTGNYSNLKMWLQSHKLTDKFTKKKLSSKAPPDKRINESDITAAA